MFGGVLVAADPNLCDSTDGTAVIAFAQASDPNYTIYCDQTQFHISVPGPVRLAARIRCSHGLNVSGTFQSYPGTRELRFRLDQPGLPAADS